MIWLIVAVATVLFFFVLHALLSKGHDSVRKPKNRSPVRNDRQTAEWSPVKNMDSYGDTAQGVDTINFISAGCADDIATGIPMDTKEGINRIFSIETPTSDVARPIFGIDDVADVVRRQVSSRISSLKDFSAVHQLQRMMGDPKSTMAELARLITSNPILSAKILQVANSSYYGMEQKLNSISHAIMIIGMANLRSIIYHEGILHALKEKSFHDRPAMQILWQHVNYTSIYASYIQYLFEGLNIGNLFTLGLLHDIGKFVIMRLDPLEKDHGDRPIREYSPDWTTAEEEEVYGINHAIVGRLAMQHWGLSPLMVEMVTLHHAPAYLSPAELGLDREGLQYLLVLFLADQAARWFAGSDKENIRMDRLHATYHGLIDQNKLFRLMTDKSLLMQLRETEAVTGFYA